MIADGRYTATIDRIEDEETAVLLVEEDNRIAAQVNVPVEQLPENAQVGGAVLEIELADGELRSAVYDPETTDARRRRRRERFDELAERPPERDDGDDDG